MSSYVKLFDSIFLSTIWQEDNPTRIVWITLLGKKDRDGVVQASIPGLAHLARVSIPEAEAAINKFLAPDPYSRTPEHEGRRIEAVPGGWLILNHDKYVELLSLEDRRRRNADRQARHRDKARNAKSVTECDKLQMSPHVDVVEVVVVDKDQTHTPTVKQAAERVCVALGLHGDRNKSRMTAVLAGEVQRSGKPVDVIEALALSRVAEYKSTPDKPFEYGSILAFYEHGSWLHPETWVSAKPKSQAASSGKPVRPTASVSDRQSLQQGAIAAENVRWWCSGCRVVVAYRAESCTNASCANAGVALDWAKADPDAERKRQEALERKLIQEGIDRRAKAKEAKGCCVSH